MDRPDFDEQVHTNNDRSYFIGNLSFYERVHLQAALSLISDPNMTTMERAIEGAHEFADKYMNDLYKRRSARQ